MFVLISIAQLTKFHKYNGVQNCEQCVKSSGRPNLPFLRILDSHASQWTTFYFRICGCIGTFISPDDFQQVPVKNVSYLLGSTLSPKPPPLPSRITYSFFANITWDSWAIQTSCWRLSTVTHLFLCRKATLKWVIRSLKVFFLDGKYFQIWHYGTYIMIGILCVLPLGFTYPMIANPAYVEYNPLSDTYVARTHADLSFLYSALIVWMIVTIILSVFVNTLCWYRISKYSQQTRQQSEYRLFLVSFVTFLFQIAAFSIGVGFFQ